MPAGTPSSLRREDSASTFDTEPNCSTPWGNPITAIVCQEGGSGGGESVTLVAQLCWEYGRTQGPPTPQPSKPKNSFDGCLKCKHTSIHSMSTPPFEHVYIHTHIHFSFPPEFLRQIAPSNHSETAATHSMPGVRLSTHTGSTKQLFHSPQPPSESQSHFTVSPPLVGTPDCRSQYSKL